MKDVNIEISGHNVSCAAVVKHSKEVFIDANVNNFNGADLSDMYDKCEKAIAAANKPLKQAVQNIEPVTTEPIAKSTDGKESGVNGDSAKKKPNSTSKK